MGVFLWFLLTTKSRSSQREKQSIYTSCLCRKMSFKKLVLSCTYLSKITMKATYQTPRLTLTELTVSYAPFILELINTP